MLRVATASLFLTACGGSGIENTVTAQTPVTPLVPSVTTTLTGQVTLSGSTAECIIIAQSLSGDPINDGARSDQSGAFTLDLGTYNADLLLTASDCTYTDAITNSSVAIDGVFRSFVIQSDFNTANAANVITAQITPFTELALRHAESIDTSATLTSATLSQVDALFSSTFERLNFAYRNTSPVLATDTASLTANQASRDYGLALAALSGAGDITGVLDGLTQDLSSQGVGLTEAELSAFLLDDLKDGAAAFEMTGQNMSGDSSINLILSSFVGDGDASPASTSAPVASVDNFIVNVESASSPNRTVAWETLFSDADSPDGSLEYVILGDICGNSADTSSSLTLACNIPGSYSFFVAAIDPDGNVTVIPATANINLPLTDTQASSFLISSTFGPTLDTIEDFESQGYSDWFQTQFNLPINSILDGMVLPFVDTSTSKWETVPRERWYERAVLAMINYASGPLLRSPKYS